MNEKLKPAQTEEFLNQQVNLLIQEREKYLMLRGGNDRWFQSKKKYKKKTRKQLNEAIKSMLIIPKLSHNRFEGLREILFSICMTLKVSPNAVGKCFSYLRVDDISDIVEFRNILNRAVEELEFLIKEVTAQGLAGFTELQPCRYRAGFSDFKSKSFWCSKLSTDKKEGGEPMPFSNHTLRRKIDSGEFKVWERSRRAKTCAIHEETLQRILGSGNYDYLMPGNKSN